MHASSDYWEPVPKLHATSCNHVTHQRLPVGATTASARGGGGRCLPPTAGACRLVRTRPARPGVGEHRQRDGRLQGLNAPRREGDLHEHVQQYKPAPECGLDEQGNGPV